MNLGELEQTTKDSYTQVSGLWSKRHDSKRYWGISFDQFFEALPTGRVLEVGCGTGRDALELVGHGYDYLGTDISEGMINEAKKRLPKQQFEQISVYDLNFKDKFDGFWCAACLIHIPKARMNEALQAIKKNIRLGGVGFISVKEGVGDLLEQRDDLDSKKFYFVFWQNEEFKKVLKKNGFEVIHENYMPMSERTKWLCYIVKSR